MSRNSQDEMFIQVIRANPLPVVWCKLPGWEVVCYSDRFTAAFGYTWEDVPTLDAWFAKAYPDPAYRELVRVQWRGFHEDYARTGTPVPDREVRICAKDGSLRDVVISTQVQPDWVLVSFLDITRVRSTENRLQDSETRYRRLFENMTSAFSLNEIMYDESGLPVGLKVLEVNPAWTVHTGLPASQVVGRVMQGMETDLEPGWLLRVDHVVKTGEPYSYTHYSPALNRWYESHIFCPQAGQFAALFNDVSETVRAREDLARLNGELEQRIAERTLELEQSTRQLMESEKLASLGALVAGIAHEVNTPLGTAYTAASYLAEVMKHDQIMSKQLSASLVEGMDMIMRNLERASGIIKSFRQFSADQTSGMSREFLLHELVKDVLTSLHPRLRKSGATVSSDVPQGLLFNGPAGDLSQVLTNLVMNAVVHGISPAFPAIIITIKARLLEGRFEIEVGNNGEPISEEVRDRIFDPFFTTKRSSGGTGLGLSIVHSIITQRCNGSIRCDSGGSGGVVFHMDIPLGPDQPIKFPKPPTSIQV